MVRVSQKRVAGSDLNSQLTAYMPIPTEVNAK